MSSDPIADMLCKIVNASYVRSERVDIPASKIKERISRLLQNEGFIKSYKLIEDRKQGILRVYLKYGPRNEMVVSGAKRTSKPGLRKYIKAGEVPVIQGGFGLVIVSTPKGLMSGKEAKTQKIGGELLCYIW